MEAELLLSKHKNRLMNKSISYNKWKPYSWVYHFPTQMGLVWPAEEKKETQWPLLLYRSVPTALSDTLHFLLQERKGRQALPHPLGKEVKKKTGKRRRGIRKKETDGLLVLSVSCFVFLRLSLVSLSSPVSFCSLLPSQSLSISLSVSLLYCSFSSLSPFICFFLSLKEAGPRPGPPAGGPPKNLFSSSPSKHSTSPLSFIFTFMFLFTHCSAEVLKVLTGELWCTAISWVKGAPISLYTASRCSYEIEEVTERKKIQKGDRGGDIGKWDRGEEVGQEAQKERKGQEARQRDRNTDEDNDKVTVSTNTQD